MNIFQVLFDKDFNTFKKLLESGEVSVNIKNNHGLSLLEIICMKTKPRNTDSLSYIDNDYYEILLYILSFPELNINIPFQLYMDNRESYPYEYFLHFVLLSMSPNLTERKNILSLILSINYTKEINFNFTTDPSDIPIIHYIILRDKEYLSNILNRSNFHLSDKSVFRLIDSFLPFFSSSSNSSFLLYAQGLLEVFNYLDASRINMRDHADRSILEKFPIYYNMLPILEYFLNRKDFDINYKNGKYIQDVFINLHRIRKSNNLKIVSLLLKNPRVNKDILDENGDNLIYTNFKDSLDWELSISQNNLENKLTTSFYLQHYKLVKPYNKKKNSLVSILNDIEE